MKKNKLLLLLLLFPLSGCTLFEASGNFSWSKYANEDYAMSIESSKFKNYKLQDFNIESERDQLLNVVKNKGSSSDFIKYYNAISSDIVKILNCYVVATTKYYANCDRNYQQKADKYYTEYIDTTKFLMSLESEIANSSNSIKSAYFGDISDEEIQRRINGNQESIIEADYDKIFNDYQDEGSELYLKYCQDGDSETYLDTGYDYLLRYINKANELCSQLSRYDNYLDYSYDYYYSRDYKIDDALKFVDYVKQYFVPIFRDKKGLTVPDDVSSSRLKVFDRYNFCNSMLDSADMFQKYAEEMGGRYLEAYNNAFKYGYYCFSNSENSMMTAYEWSLNGSNDAVLYFSKDYQNVMTITHEFGHYYSCTQNRGIRKYDAYDLQETYSQANEFTFLNYLLGQKKDDEFASTYNYYADNKIYNSLYSIIREAAITEVENFMYTTPNLTKETLREGVEEILDSYEGTSGGEYFMGACLSSPCYYISYATSLMEALQFSVMSFEDAKKNYTKLVEADEGLDMVGRWENAGLVSPFKEGTFKTLAKLFDGIANKY